MLPRCLAGVWKQVASVLCVSLIARRFSALCIIHLTHHQSVSYQSLTFDRESDISFVCVSVLEPENRELRSTRYNAL
jgi:hypothetical protein